MECLANYGETQGQLNILQLLNALARTATLENSDKVMTMLESGNGFKSFFVRERVGYRLAISPVCHAQPSRPRICSPLRAKTAHVKNPVVPAKDPVCARRRERCRPHRRSRHVPRVGHGAHSAVRHVRAVPTSLGVRSRLVANAGISNGARPFERERFGRAGPRRRSERIDLKTNIDHVRLWNEVKTAAAIVSEPELILALGFTVSSSAQFVLFLRDPVPASKAAP